LARMRESAQQSVPPQRPSQSAAPKVGRNDLCPCGSGKKFKKCHGASLEDEEEEERPTV
jgi:preprotein translocase subunit SecA